MLRQIIIIAFIKLVYAYLVFFWKKDLSHLGVVGGRASLTGRVGEEGNAE